MLWVVDHTLIIDPNRKLFATVDSESGNFMIVAPCGIDSEEEIEELDEDLEVLEEE